MSEIADELSRRATPRYIGEQVRGRAMEWKEDFISSPTALGLIGGVLGAAVGRAFARNRRESQFRRPRYSGYGPRADLRYGVDSGYGDWRESGDRSRETDGGGMREKIAEGAQDLKDRATDMVSDVRERIPSMAELGHKAEDNPAILALGGLALGAIAALLLPVTRKERELLDPVKQRASEAISTLGNQITDSAQQAREKVTGSDEQRSQSAEFPPAVDPSPLTH